MKFVGYDDDNNNNDDNDDNDDDDANTTGPRTKNERKKKEESNKESKKDSPPHKVIWRYFPMARTKNIGSKRDKRKKSGKYWGPRRNGWAGAVLAVPLP